MHSRHRPVFTEDYMPQPSVIGPDISSWNLGVVRDFSASTGYGFVLSDPAEYDVLLHAAARVVPKRRRDDRTLNVLFSLDQKCDWTKADIPVNGAQVYYRPWYGKGLHKARAIAWCMLSDIQSRDMSLHEEQQSYTKLPHFTLCIETISTGNLHKFFRTNRPFRTLQRWLQTRNYLGGDERVVCLMELNKATLRYEVYDALRQAIARLPPDIRSL